jgi:ABC-2 type transport system permease protein
MTLTRLLIRRHRLALTSWLLLLIGLSAGTVGAYQNTYATDQQRRAAVALAQADGATTLMYGRLPGPGAPAQMYAWEIGAFVTILAAVMAVLLAVALTRTAEDDGTAELVRGCGIGPRRPLTAALGVLAGCAAVLAAGCTAAAGIHHGAVDGITWPGAAAYGAAVGLTFLLVAVLTTLLAQVAANGSQARLLGLTAVGMSFAVRALADTRDAGWLNWLSPLGLRAVVEPFTSDRWSALIPGLLASAALAAAAMVLAGRREFGAGLIRRRDARVVRLRIRSALGLAARLARGPVVTWTVGVTAIGTLFSTMGSGVVDLQRTGDVGGFLGAQVSGADPAAGYLAYCGTVVGIIVCAYAILSVSAGRHAENIGLTGMVLATGVSRWKPLAAQAAVTAAGCAVILTATGVLSALVAPSTVRGDDIASRAFTYTIGQWPAATALIGFTALLTGAVPRLTALAWLPLATSAALALLGDLLKVPRGVQNLGLFRHVPDVAAPHPSIAALLLIIGAGAGLGLIGLGAVSRRDLATG